MVLLGMVLLTKPLQAQVYYFTLDGFQGGGSISGSFTGVDVNEDNYLTLDWQHKEEISNFTASFTGNTASPYVAAFDLNNADLLGLQFKLSDGNIVTDAGNNIFSITSVRLLKK